ncbi:hypothetical protein [Neisseria meningitidis]|uniref:hypothetical protein n=1 Tax=Neisseria meningitidis TaxID=487 RepID=UPI0035A3B68F
MAGHRNVQYRQTPCRIEKHNSKPNARTAATQSTGVLPWVSNIGEEHILGKYRPNRRGYVMFITGGQWKRKPAKLPEFCAPRRHAHLSA